MLKLIAPMLAVAISSTAALAASQADIAGTYSGKLSGGSAVQVTIPESGAPKYRFRGSSVTVNSSKMTGKSIRMDVGSGHGTVVLTPKGKGKLGFQYHFQGDNASTTLMKQ